MAMNCGASFAKFLLILFNVVFMIGGVALAVLGIYLLIDDKILDIANLANYIDTDEDIVKKLCIGCVIIGVCIFILSIVGIIGAASENRCLLGLYFFIVLVLLIGNCTIVVFAFRYKDKVIDKIETTISKRLTTHNYTGSFAKSMDVTQVELKCCGVTSPKNFATSKFNKYHVDLYVPYSCCKLNNNKHKDFNITASNVLNATLCQQEYLELNKTTYDFKFLNNEGCSHEFKDWIKEKAFILIGVAIGIMCIQIFGIIFAICLCRNTDLD